MTKDEMENLFTDELDHSSTYEELHQHYAIARLVPESMVALVSGLQLDTDKLDMLKGYGYTIQEYWNLFKKVVDTLERYCYT